MESIFDIDKPKRITGIKTGSFLFGGKIINILPTEIIISEEQCIFDETSNESILTLKQIFRIEKITIIVKNIIFNSSINFCGIELNPVYPIIKGTKGYKKVTFNVKINEEITISNTKIKRSHNEFGIIFAENLILKNVDFNCSKITCYSKLPELINSKIECQIWLYLVQHEYLDKNHDTRINQKGINKVTIKKL